MIDRKLIISNMDFIESIIQNGASPNTNPWWEPIVDMLSQDEIETEQFLNTLDKHHLNTITECFEEVSYRLKSKSFIEFLESLSEQYHDIDFSNDIKYAKLALEE